MTEKNPTFVLQEVDKFKYEDRSVPKIQDLHDVIVEVKYTGICGSDVHYWAEGKIGDFVVEEPLVLGHESSGLVHSVGDAVKGIRKGDQVAVEPSLPCRICTRCKEGRYNLCPDMKFAATPPINGTLCKYYQVPEDFCYKLPENVSLEEGALMEPTSVAVHVCNQIEMAAGKSIVVFGAGPVGLLTCAVAQAMGASKIVNVDIKEERLKFSKGYAATHTLLPGKDEKPQDIAKRIIKECGLGSGADTVVDATGASVCIQTGIHVARAGGIYCQAGMGAPETTFPIGAICPKELTVKGCFRYAEGDYALSLYLLSTGKIEVKSLISQKVKFENAEQAFKDTKEGKGIKILIEGPSA